jgi:hypothetical protein
MERIFPFQHLDINEGVKYLGFTLKPNNYGKVDWGWILTRIKITFLSGAIGGSLGGGRLVLVKSVLEAIPVFWHTLAHIPKGVLERIRKCCFNFLWKGSSEYKGSHLARWKLIATPKSQGGLGAQRYSLVWLVLSCKVPMEFTYKRQSLEEDHHT